MKRKSTQTQGIKRKIAILLSIAMLFTLVFTGTALAEEVTAYESVNYAELEEPPENGSPGDFEPNWDHSDQHWNHLNFIRTGNTSGISARGVQLLEAGMMMADGLTRGGQNILCRNISGQNCRDQQGRERLKGLRAAEYRGFHGYHVTRQNGVWRESNYVTSFYLITRIANRGGETTSLANPGLQGGTGGAFFNIRSRFRRTEGVGAAEGMRLSCSAGHSTFRTWQQIMDLHGLEAAYRDQVNQGGVNGSGATSFRRHFIWGLALHTLSDTFEHSAIVRFNNNNNLWHTIIHPGGLTTEQRAVRFDAARDAVNLALAVIARPATHNHRHGCCCKFIIASGRFTGSNFRMANLARHVVQNRMVANNTVLSAAQLAQFRRGDIWFPVSFPTLQNAANYNGTWPPNCSRCNRLACVC